MKLIQNRKNAIVADCDVNWRSYHYTIFSVLKKLQLFILAECCEGYRRDADSGDCVACPKGTYSDMIDGDSCTSCPEGKTTLDEGTDDASLRFGNVKPVL